MRAEESCAPQDGALSLTRLLAAFTLVEMLVVIAIIGILAAILLPVLSAARERSRQASCTSQLHQFSVAIETYKNDNDSQFTPPWLSVLYPSYLGTDKIFICPSDTTRGLSGSVPTWFAKPQYGASLFTETDDTPNAALPTTMPSGWNYTPTGWNMNVWQAAQTTTPALAGQATPKGWPYIVSLRNPSIRCCSYIYEFCWSPCTWVDNNPPKNYISEDTPGHLWPDSNNDGVLSWREIKASEQKGTYFNTTTKTVQVDPSTKYGGMVPIIRCFWHGNACHANDNNNFPPDQMALNLASGNLNVYPSMIPGARWQNAGQK